MRTYESRVSRDRRFQGEISRVDTIQQRWWSVRLTVLGKRTKTVSETRMPTLAEARDVVRDWVTQ